MKSKNVSFGAALVEAFDDRDVHAFFEHRAAFGSHAEAADIDHVRGVGEQADDAAVMEGGRDDGEVVQMAGAEPGIVGDVVIARAASCRREISAGSGRRFPPLN